MLIKKYTLPGVHNFGNFILENRKKVSPRVFADEFGKLKRDYVKYHEEDKFSKESNVLLDRLLKEQELDFAGIVISILCKLNQSNPRYLEYFAQKGYNLSKIKGDYVHMMARLNDLRKIYIDCEDRFFDYIQVLYKQEKCLQQLTQNYPETSTNFRTVTRQIAEKEAYERMLAYIQTEIGKLTRKKHPHHALKKLISAQKIFKKNRNTQSVDYINGLIRDIKAGQNVTQ